ncbi:MAG: cupin domain-containing protein, partial [Chloroflexus sp.]
FDAKTLCLGIVEIDPGHHSPLHRHNCEEVYYVIKGSGEIESDGKRYKFSAGCAIFNRPNTIHRVWNTGDETIQLAVVGGIMFVPLWPKWPTASPYEVFEGTSANAELAKSEKKSNKRKRAK